MVYLLIFFFRGFEDESREATDEEWALLKDVKGFDIDMDLYRLPTQKMNTVLYETFSTTLEDMSGSAFDGLTYLDSTDCYYFMTTGTNFTDEFKITGSESCEDGAIRITYTAAFVDEHTVTLRPAKDGYIIVSNLPA